MRIVAQVARLVPHLSNGVFVVSERGLDKELDALFEDRLAFIPKGKQRVSPLVCANADAAHPAASCTRAL